MKKTALNKQLKELGVTKAKFQNIVERLVSNSNSITYEEFKILKKSLISKIEEKMFLSVIQTNSHLQTLENKYQESLKQHTPSNTIQQLAKSISKLSHDTSVT